MKNIKNALLISLCLFLICGIAYPLAMTGISQAIFNKQANGSIIEYNGKNIGSEVLGQKFEDTKFFHGRISSINYNTYTKEDTKKDKNGNVKYTGVSSGCQNLAPSNEILKERVQSDIAEFLKTHKDVDKKDIPTDLLTSSASGLDPNISVASANIQIPLISKSTGISDEKLEEIVKDNIEGRQFGIFGEPRVNVLKLNIKIASLLKK